jgi:hypothetical protein
VLFSLLEIQNKKGVEFYKWFCVNLGSW